MKEMFSHDKSIYIKNRDTLLSMRLHVELPLSSCFYSCNIFCGDFNSGHGTLSSHSVSERNFSTGRVERGPLWNMSVPASVTETDSLIYGVAISSHDVGCLQQGGVPADT